jgi:hypothetical protein
MPYLVFEKRRESEGARDWKAETGGGRPELCKLEGLADSSGRLILMPDTSGIIVRQI